MDQRIVDLETKRLEKLPPREVGPYLMTLPAKKRMETILARADAQAVVAALPEQDFYLTLKEIGPEDALPLLELARVDQINHVFDLEMWRKDRIVPGPAIQWLDRLYRASGRKLLAWLYHADFEFLVSLFKKWLRVVQVPEDKDLTEALDGLPKNTLDDQYFWEARYPQHEDLLRNILNFLFETHHGFYKELMDHLIWALDAEVEEEAYRFHRGRLEDRAIPDYYDALEIYKALDPGDLTHDKLLLERDGEDAVNPPAFALVAVPEGALLWRALAGVEHPRVVETLQLEMASLANKVVVADAVSPEDVEDLHEAAGKAAAMVNLGLELITAGDVTLARSALEQIYLEHLFRLGHGKVAEVQRSLRRIVKGGWLSRWPSGLTILDWPWSERVEGLLEKTAKVTRLQGKERPRLVPSFIQDRGDLRDAAHWVRVVAALAPVFESLQADTSQLAESLWAEAQVRILEEVTLGSLLFTAAAWNLLGQSRRVEPLPVERWPEIFSAADPESVAESLQGFVDTCVEGDKRRRLVWEYVQDLVDRYDEETRAFRGSDPPDLRLMPFFLFRPPR
ncbi:hypothetical protein SAMN02746041_00546 [Desulfacinum hydrothermale DSM 13146]|uniref:Uncharacterized protein n=1 Tax=Desulfacinum hydrothermale DSM 13146 TaxID=1121390 RepID=A0A1W1X4Q0_9BACT|nr:DUF6178 family protein [Desulfacinum hydrothermale]SMC18830.1 hypothetical protein SAMN02746041_00546 [Desulfacinum hydrothermale DSM 13146]